jgi:tRNA threonylcarbamoyladenosine biosynthesis protein TsaB
MNTKPNTVLAIESAISGGSISLQRDGIEIGGWLGESSVSRAEDLLANIDGLMAQHGVSCRDLDLVAVSAGPGSFTGIRIGIATALGLKTGLGIQMASESALKAIAYTQPDNEHLTVAVPAGREAVCVQSFAKTGKELAEIDQPHTIRESDLLSSLCVENSGSVALHSSLFAQAPSSAGVIDVGANVAFAIGQICAAAPGTITEPLFIAKGF